MVCEKMINFGASYKSLIQKKNGIIMNKNEKFVITINRELGSGGRTIGRKLAERLGVEFFDKALIRAMEEKYNLTAEEIEKLKGRHNNWWEYFTRVMRLGDSEIRHYQSQNGGEFEKLTTENVFKAEKDILEGIAEEESCVVAGRCGFFVFQNHPNHLSIFIQASMPFRLERVVRKQNKTPEEARKIIDKIDKMRENYVQKFTGTSRYDTRNYNLVISADGKTEDEIVDVIMKYIDN